MMEKKLLFIPISMLFAVGAAFAAHTATVTNIPTSAPGDTSTSFTLTVANDATSSDDINNVRLVVSSGFTSVACGAPPPQWSCTTNGNNITWDTTNPGRDIAPRKDEDFPWSAMTPSSSGTYYHDWYTTDTASGTDSGQVSTDITVAEFLMPMIPLLMGIGIYLMIRKTVFGDACGKN
jgi:uncharacterized protein YcnI